MRFSLLSFVSVPRCPSVSLEQARQAQDDGGGEDPAHDDEDHAPHLCGPVRDPGIAYVETDDWKQEVEGVEERLEGWLDVRLVGGSQLAPVDRAEEPGAEDQEAGQPESSQPCAVAVAHQTIEHVSSYPPRQVALGETAALLGDKDASGVVVMPGAAVDSSELVVDLR